MELKTYQKNVIADLARYLELLVETGSASKAYERLWTEKSVNIGFNGLQSYRHNLKGGVPDVCFKVPTGGGKTYLAASAIKTIYDALPTRTVRAVVWLVPSDAILTQTYAALSNPNHPYRQRLDVDFGSNVQVYSKEQLLNGQQFQPENVRRQLSVFVLSYDSFRTSKKEGRKAYQENGSLMEFPKMMPDKSMLLPDTDETALIQVIRSLNPVVIVDESHHATSNLSVEMLENFNPCFVLDLTATPKKNSNVISFVDAAQLKKANMVKLPVIVYNRKTQEDVYYDAISLRHKLEQQAILELKTTGRYIRPIVLLQAQPRTSAGSTTYEKIKKELIDAGIPQDQIAIKTGDKDELKRVNLLSQDCPIRFIITVNALKEGWDCPFAYILATVANRSSAVDVEQILGRVLRLPYTQKNGSNVLNLSYVITSSADFGQTLEKVVAGLNNAGFSRKDCRAKDFEPEPEPVAPQPTQTEIKALQELEIPEVNPESLRERIQQALAPAAPLTTQEIEADPMFAEALQQNEDYEKQTAGKVETPFDLAPVEVRDKMNVFRINDIFAEEASALRIPQFMLRIGASFFTDNPYTLLQQAHLDEGFTLRDKDVQIDFNTMDVEIARVDTDDSVDAAPKVWKIQGTDSTYFKEWFQAQPSEKRLENCVYRIKQRLSKRNCIHDAELDDYIKRIVATMSEDQIGDMERSVYPYIQKIEKKVDALLAAHRAKQFELWLEQEKIICSPFYALPPYISPTKVTSSYPKSLYSSEEDMNELERKTVFALSSMENIKWWHRNISRLGFMINGAVHAYPDLIVMTSSRKILLVETKGDHLDNAESKEKAKTGAKWASLAGNQYRYFMVFDSKQPDYPGAYSYDRFIEIVRGL